MDSGTSPAALAANRRLVELRARLTAERAERGGPAADERAGGRASVGAWLAAHRYAPLAGGGAWPAAVTADESPAGGAPGPRKNASHSLWELSASAATLVPTSSGQMPAAGAPAATGRDTARQGEATGATGPSTTASHNLSELPASATMPIPTSFGQMAAATTGAAAITAARPNHGPTADEQPAGECRRPIIVAYDLLPPVAAIADPTISPSHANHSPAGQGRPPGEAGPPTSSSHSLSGKHTPAVPRVAALTTRHNPVGEGRPAERVAATIAGPLGPAAAAGRAGVEWKQPAAASHSLDSGLSHDPAGREASAPATTRPAGAAQATTGITSAAVEIHPAVETTAPIAVELVICAPEGNTGRATAETTAAPAGCQPALHGPAALENADSTQTTNDERRTTNNVSIGYPPLATCHSPLAACHPSDDSLAALADHIAALPPHLGWGSETLTAHLRQRRGASAVPADAGEQESRGAGEQGGKGERENAPEDGDAPPAICHPPPATCHPPLVKVYPDIALGILRAERAAAGRVWLLLRHLDAAGRGMVSLAAARAALTGRASPLRLCGPRRLRQLLAEGEGVFWAREQGRDRQPAADQWPPASDNGPRTTDRLRLFGPARVAAALGVARLTGRPVAVPVAALRGSIGDARAQLYATFHSGRARELLSAPASPISRAALTTLSGACPRSQAAYERRAGVLAQPNIALGEQVADGANAVVGPAEQERAWQRGRALFRLKDYRGRFGRPGAVYLAWRLPNGYGPARGQQQSPRGRQKRINRRLTDLFTQGMTGNGRVAVEKRFFGTAVGAVKAVQGGKACSAGIPACGGQGRRGKGRQPAEVHWPIGQARHGLGVWATVGGAASFLGE